MRKIIVLMIGGLLSSCGTTKTTLGLGRLETFQTLKLKEAVDLESTFGSLNNTPDHNIAISTEIYPNRRNFKLATPQTYVRDEDYFQNEVSYYYSESDSSVKVILYQWDEKNIDYKGRNEREGKFKKFEGQWNDIVKEVTKQLGRPTSVRMESNNYKIKANDDQTNLEEMMLTLGNDSNNNTAWRDDIKWERNSSIYAYLFMFGDNETGYRQVRLAIYGE